jgi:hypothetical protein
MIESLLRCGHRLRLPGPVDVDAVARLVAALESRTCPSCGVRRMADTAALNPNVHFHAGVLDGVFRHPGRGRSPVFRAGRRLGRSDLAEILLTVRVRVQALLRRRGLSDDTAAQELAERAPMIAEARGRVGAGGGADPAAAVTPDHVLQ